MAFQSYDELIKMASTNPKKATQYVQAAQQSNRPVVSADNPGYGNESAREAALKRSMKQKTPASAPQDDLVQQRKNINY